MVLDGPGLAPLEHVGARGDLAGPLDDVLAVVTTLRNGLAGPARRERRREQLHLGAAIVQVVLPSHVVAAPLEHPRQRIAVRRAAPVTGVQRARRVGAHELDHHPRPDPEAEPGVPVDALADDVAQHVVQPRVGQTEVHETRSGHLDGQHVVGRGRVERLGQRHGQLAGVAAGLLGCGQRHVARPVTVLAPGRALELDLVGERVDLERVQGGAQGIGELVADQRGSSFGMVNRMSGRPGGWMRRERDAPAWAGERGLTLSGTPSSARSGIEQERRPEGDSGPQGWRATLVPLALVAQRIEHRPPEAVAQVRVLPRALRSGSPTQRTDHCTERGPTCGC